MYQHFGEDKMGDICLKVIASMDMERTYGPSPNLSVLPPRALEPINICDETFQSITNINMEQNRGNFQPQQIIALCQIASTLESDEQSRCLMICFKPRVPKRLAQDAKKYNPWTAFEEHDDRKRWGSHGKVKNDVLSSSGKQRVRFN